MKERPLILDGRAARDEIRARLKKEFGMFAKPRALAIVQVGDDSASSAYIKQKILFGKSVVARVIHEKLPVGANESEVADCISALSANPSVSGIIVQLPLPVHLEKEKILNLVPGDMDVDGLSAASRARLAAGDASGFIPATARGVYELLLHYGVSVSGKKVTVFGRSLIAGGPIAQLLSAKGGRVTVLHSQTPIAEAQKISRNSDIVVVAIGKPKFVGRAYFRDDKTQIVVDVGINRMTTGVALQEEVPRANLVGDVDFDAVKNMVSAISPVPGGVGPMTVACLFENLLDAYK